VPLTSAYDDAHERVAALGRAIQAAVRPHHDLPIRPDQSGGSGE
jgi:hypothetical protein